MYYALINNEPVKVSLEYFIENKMHDILFRDKINDVIISTVFLGLDHNHNQSGKPILFETMIFGGAHDEYMERCSDYKTAIKMHRTGLELVISSLNESYLKSTLGGQGDRITKRPWCGNPGEK